VKTAEQFSSPPKDYRVIVPDGWFQVLLDPPDERDRAIVALADLTFRGVDNAPHLKSNSCGTSSLMDTIHSSA
jgi:hypothetical protein